ncbi:alpha/beta hydrolase [Periweissella fabalis]|uniref:Alpha/beta hydrolase n=1 Tax=Periweissella fabalis TaxID=1070421 RepID=A0A7X6S2N1_9LACO|nr:alpha/beta hydrolase [Periweissella fabalis]MCM0599424.1 alpha/beta hydrolase [Periweissella fabalis]NKZ23703.1 alpha/beta hydrolase [Periweissella fabalis]
MKPSSILDSEYQKRYHSLKINKTNLGYTIGLDKLASSMDAWHVEIKQNQQISKRVEVRLNQLWEEQDYLGLAHLMQFTPDKYSIVRSPVSVLHNTRMINKDLSASIYTLSPQPIKRVLIFIHGGGLINGSTKRATDWLHKLLSQLGDGWAIVNVEYPLITQLKINLLLDALVPMCEIIHQWYPTAKLYIAGDSSGAGLAMHVVRQNTSIISGQILIYPQCQFGGANQVNAASEISFLTDFKRMLNVQTALINQQVNKTFTWDINLNIPTLIIKAEYDIFNATLAARLEPIEQSAELLRIDTFQGMFHGFMDYFGILPQAEFATYQISAWLMQY